VNSTIIVESVFVKKAAEIVLDHLDKADFSGNDLASHLHLSREQTHRKLKKNTTLSTGKFIRYLRLLRAYQYIWQGEYSMAEIGYKVGFDSSTYFSKCFKEEWSVPPGEVRKGNHLNRLTKTSIYAFYQLPAIQKVLSDRAIHVNFPIEGRSRKSQRRLWALVAISTVLLMIAISNLFLTGEKQSNSLIIPDDSRIAVIPLANQTGDSLMNQVGDIASSWISSQLDELPGVKTVPFFTIQEYQSYIGILPNDPGGRPTFSEVVGARYFVTGSYFLKGQQLYMDTRLLDAYTQESVYHLPVVEGPKDSVMQIIENLRLKIAGLVTNLEEVKLGKLTPPNYEAYKYYLRGLEEMAIGLNPDAVTYFEKASALEPEFIMPLMYLTWFYYGEKRDSVIRQMAEIPNITNYEERMFRELRLFWDRNYQEALQIDLQILEDYPQDYFFNMLTAHRAKSQFMPHLAIRVLSQLYDPLSSDIGLMWQYFKIQHYTVSLMMLRRYEDALDYLESIPEEFYNPNIPNLLTYVYVNLGRNQGEIEKFLNSLSPSDEKLRADYYMNAAYEFGLEGKDEASLYFVRKAATLMRALPNQAAYEFDMIDVLFLLGDFDGAKEDLKKKIQEEPSDDYLIYLGLVEAALGNETEAVRLYAQLEGRELILWRRNNLEYQTDYLNARIYALLGQKDRAVQLLKSALEKGQLFHNYDFYRDIYLKPLFDYPPFQALVQPREYADITAVP